MNEPMHLVPRQIILNLMELLKANNLIDDNDFAREQYDALDKITDKTPDNQSIKQ